ncbi:DUF2892 domain-containing protein [Balneolaceae bacterium YR4-1]|uniref:DUF2892 domain-containing protein n=1 Tax=Halalkalibaculum roseum TaxID=2709311 RepID=A0A6M1T3C7_9BACT|nr:DUF2892 domain-containing protein [Halalkalibaculum roseum]NGP77964.1 DUF2892 domain-containing protein [Halalkalibaculum roseum]
MKKNMGFADRTIRSLLALLMIALYYFEVISGTLGIVLIAISVIFLLTSLVSFCPLYAPFGLSTSKTESES